MAENKSNPSAADAHFEPQTAGKPSFQPRLGLFSAATIVMGSMVGSGIFIVSADIARLTGSPGWLLAVWAAAGLVTLLGAASYARLAAYLPCAGGQYVFLREAWGPLPAFLYGWALLMIIQSGFLAAVAVAFAKYLGHFLPVVSSEPLFHLLPGWGISIAQLVSVAVILGLTAYHTTGVQYGAWLQNILTVLKVLSLLVLIAVGLAAPWLIHWFVGKAPAAPGALSASIFTDMAAHPVSLGVFAAAMVGALFSADAWNYVTFIGEEVKQASRNLPRALIMGTAVVIGLYLLSNVAYLAAMPFDAIANAPEDRVAASMFSLVSGGSGAALISAMILISTLGCLNGLMLAGARVFYAMAKDGLMFKKLGELHPKTLTPNAALWLQAAVGAVLALSGSYGQLLDYLVFAALVFYIVTIAGLFRLKQRPDFPAFSPVIPVLYIVLVSVIAACLLVDPIKWKTSVIGLGLVATGLPIYYLWRRQAR